MISRERVLDVAGQVVGVLPNYHPDAADINEALDDGVASCAARAYAAGLLLRGAYPNPDLYDIKFGFAPEHGTEYAGREGTYVRMGHAVVRFSVLGYKPMIVETYTDGAVEVMSPTEVHEGYTWMELDDGYQTYLDKAELDLVIRPRELLSHLLRCVADA